MTSGDLAFANKGLWLEDTRFDYVEGHEFASYWGQSRYTFNSVADTPLYSRFLELVTGDPQFQRFAELWPGFMPTNWTEAALQFPQAERYADFPPELDVLAYLEKQGNALDLGNVRVSFSESTLNLLAANEDPILLFPNFELAGGRDYQLVVTLKAPQTTTAQLFHKAGNETSFNEQNSEARTLERGENTISWSFSIAEAPDELRLDLGTIVGRYGISRM